MVSFKKPFIAFILLLGTVALYAFQHYIFIKIETEQVKMVLEYTFPIFVWLASGRLVYSLLQSFILDPFFFTRTGSPAPKLLREVIATVIFILIAVGVLYFIFEQSLTGIWATSSVLGIVLGFALRGMIADFFTGIALNLDQPYQIGDWIEVKNRNTTVLGEVQQINWRTTRVLTQEEDIIIVPNNLMGALPIRNYSAPNAMSRFSTFMTVDFAISGDRARRVLLAGAKAARSNPGFVKDKKPEVIINQVTDLGIEYEIRYWVYPWKGVGVHQGIAPNVAEDRILENILSQLEQAGISLAYPKTDIYYKEMPERHLDVRSKADRKKLLSRIQLFSPLSESEIDHIAEKMLRRFIKAQQHIIRHGEEGSSMFILVEGLLGVYVDIDKDGKEDFLGEIEPGEFFGEMSLLTGETRSASIITTTDALIYEITRDDIIDIIRKREDVSRLMSEIIAERKLENQKTYKEFTQKGKKEAKETMMTQILGKMKSIFGFNS